MTEISITLYEQYIKLQDDIIKFNNITNLELNYKSEEILNILPNQIKKIRFGYFYKATLPDNIFNDRPYLEDLIIYNCNYYNNYDNNNHNNYDNNNHNNHGGFYLPDLRNTFIKNIYIGESIRQLPRLPKSLECINMLNANNYRGKLPELQHTSLVHLYLSCFFNEILPKLPQTLKYLWLGAYYNKPFPELKYTSLVYLHLSSYNHMQYLQYLPATLYELDFPIILNDVKTRDDIKPVILYAHKLKIIIKNNNKIYMNKYKNLCFNIKLNINYDTYHIVKDIKIFLIYILFNKQFIPFEIYDYMYEKFNFNIIID